MVDISTFTEPLWHQQIDEPDIWFVRFQEYCNMGSTRSLEKFYTDLKLRERMNLVNIQDIHQQSTQNNAISQKPKKPRIQVPPKWRDRSKDWYWEVRAIAHDKERNRLVAVEKRTQELEEYRNRRRQFGAACQGIAVQMLTKLKPKLDNLDVNRTKPAVLTALGNFARSAASVGESGGTAEGEALSVEQLIDLFLSEIEDY